MALVLYVSTTGADTNSGTSTGNSPIANGTGATRSGAVYTMTGADLSGVTANVDAIKISGETSGLGFDGTLFAITAVDDTLDTVTVSPTPTGATTGITWAIGGAVGLQEALDTCDPGDVVYVKNGTDYTGTYTLRTVGTLANPIRISGYASTINDWGIAVLDGTSQTYCMSSTLAAGYYIIESLEFKNATSKGFNSTTQDFTMMINCRFINNGGVGCTLDNDCTYVCCVSTGNSGHGLDADSNTSYIGNISGNNSGHGCFGGGSIHYKNVCYNNTNNGLSANNLVTIGNTIDGDNGASTIGINNFDTTAFVIDNLIHDCNTGIATSASREHTHTILGWNLFNSCNTNNNTSFYTSTVKETTGDPAFTDEANDDYTLGATSAAIGKGLTPGNLS